MDLIQFKNTWEMYRIKFTVDGKASWDNFWALKDINFKVGRGETLGIIGENGSGKSTILKLIMGMLKPDRGRVSVLGKVSGLLELGAGFQPELTGRENVFLTAKFFGLSRDQIEKRYEDIVNFASLGKFINATVKSYSQGMFVRLAFAIAIHMDPDILLIDDTLSVGDEFFQRKCIKKIFELKELGKTIVFVTHDMNMLQRLCDRAILLKEGRMIKDDLVRNVIPLYTQMVGIKEGVGTLGEGDLKAVFNNGRLFINWKDNLLTPHSGIYTVLRLMDKWHSSIHASWEVEKNGGDELVAKGRLYQLGLTQIWKMKMADAGGIKLDIELESEESFDIQEGCTNIMLSNEYAQWFTSLEKGKFPSLSEQNREWYALLEGNAIRKCIGAAPGKNSGKNIPSLIFEQSGCMTHTYGQVWNTDYFTNSRVLQYKNVGLQNYSGNEEESRVYFSGKILIGTPDIDNYLYELRQETVLSGKELQLQLGRGQCIILWNGNRLTKANNGSTSICANGKWYFSESAHWEFKKENKNKIIGRGTWQDLPLVQIWEIEINKDRSFCWKVDIEVSADVNIERQYARFEYSENYGYYYSDYGRGKFPEGFIEHEIDMLQRCIPDGLVAFRGRDDSIPSVALEFSKELNNFAKICNSDISKRFREMRIAKVQPEDDMRFSRGRHPCFKIGVMLNRDKALPIKESVSILRKGRLRFIFDKGRGRIYWGEHELTRKLGLYTSLRSRGRWHDSFSHVLWDAGENGGAIECSGRWLDLPITQFWRINLKEEDLIELDLMMTVDKEIEADRLQTNIMLTENYRDWVTDKDRGLFPSFKGDIDDEWEILRSHTNGNRGKNGFVGVIRDQKSGNQLPALKFFTQNTDRGGCLNIVNSDLYHRGRILQYLRKEKMLLPGEYGYYSGSILIGK